MNTSGRPSVALLVRVDFSVLPMLHQQSIAAFLEPGLCPSASQEDHVVTCGNTGRINAEFLPKTIWSMHSCNKIANDTKMLEPIPYIGFFSTITMLQAQIISILMQNILQMVRVQ